MREMRRHLLTTEGCVHPTPDFYPRHDAVPPSFTAAPPARQTARTRRIVFRLVAVPIYATVVFPLGIALFILLDGNSIMDGRLLVAVKLGLWIGAAVLLAGDLDRCWGHTRVEHALTSSVCAEIGLGIFDCLAHLVRVLPLPTLEQALLPIAALGDPSGVGAFVYALPIVALIGIQRRRAKAGWLD